MALGTVSHTKLLSVLKSYGIATTTFNWIHASLQTNAKVFVLMHYHLFYQSLMVFRAVCFDLLFLIFVNNLTVSRHRNHAVGGMFLDADDAKLFNTHTNDLQQSLISVNS